MNNRFLATLGSILLWGTWLAGALHGADSATPVPATSPAAPTPDDLKKNNPIEKLGWVKGPGSGDLQGRAFVRFPAEFRFVGAKDTGKLLELAGNQTDGTEIGALEHQADGWWVIFEFEEVGYVKDDEKKDLKADELLASFQRGAVADNKRRQEAGLPPLNVVGWHTPPNYNDETKNLEWAVILESQGEQSINHNVRLLGRKGVTKVTLVLDDLKAIDATLPKFRALLKDFAYTSGENYAEYKEGDKVAKYGLSALVLGGAAAGAYKLGLLGGLLAFFKKGWKLLIFAVAGLAAWIKNLVTGKQRPSDH
jgi:uncharacterized membrane-anchored protein